MRNHVITVRLSDDEYNYVRQKVDYFFYENASDFVRSLIKDSILDDKEEIASDERLANLRDKLKSVGIV